MGMGLKNGDEPSVSIFPSSSPERPELSNLDPASTELTLNVPPNSSALVTLPNGKQHDVGSGEWHWSEPFTSEFRTTFSLDDAVGEIMSDKAIFDAVMKTMAQLEAPGMVFGIMDGERGIPLRHILDMSGDAADRLMQAVTNVLSSSSPKVE